MINEHNSTMQAICMTYNKKHFVSAAVTAYFTSFQVFKDFVHRLPYKVFTDCNLIHETHSRPNC